MKINGSHLKTFLLIIAAIFLITSCQQKKSTEHLTISQAEMDSFHIRAAVHYPEYDNIGEMIGLLKDIDINYIPEAVNTLDNLEKYNVNDLLVAANIGVYMTDIGYMWAYNEVDYAFNHNIAVISLAEQLEMAMTFLESFFEKYNDAIADPDTLLVLIEKDLKEAVKQFPEENRMELYMAMFTGSFIEKLHLLYESIRRCAGITTSEEITLENLQKLLWIANGQMKAMEELNHLIDTTHLQNKHLLYHEELIKLDSIMLLSGFLQDSSIVRSVQLIGDPEFMNVYNEISRIRQLVINPAAETVQ